MKHDPICNELFGQETQANHPQHNCLFCIAIIKAEHRGYKQGQIDGINMASLTVKSVETTTTDALQ